MAWMAVAEAAASLGVSERTIWRRIKSNAIKSRGENGRTLVHLGGEENGVESGQPLSRMTFAQVALRNVNTDPAPEFLAVVSDLRVSFDQQIAATRRTVRLLAGAMCVLVVAFCVGIWFHFDQMTRASSQHVQAISDLEEKHNNEVGEIMASHQSELTEQAGILAHTEGQASARLEELVSLRDTSTKMTDQLASIETSRNKLESAVTKQAGAFEEATSKQLAGISERDKEIRTLREQIAVLKEDLQEAVFLGDARMSQSDKVTEYIRRSAARSIGYADGVRQHLAYRAKKERELRTELARLRANLNGSPGETHDREAIWTSIMGDDGIGHDGAAGTGDGESNSISIRTILLDCFNAWFFGRNHLDSLASASATEASVASAQP